MQAQIISLLFPIAFSMSNSRFFVDKDFIDEASGHVVIANLKQVNQICHVLRLKPAAKIFILDGQGCLYLCLIKSLSKDKVEAQILERNVASGEATVKVTVAMPLIKGGRFEWALEKLTELGIYGIQPLALKRSVVKMPESNQVLAKLAHWRAIAQESAEQCERACVPLIHAPKTLADLLQDISEYDLALIALERADTVLLVDVLADHFSRPKISKALPKHILIAVGPEGGFDDDEISQASAALKVVSLGPRILRSETAAISCVAQVIAFSQMSI